MPALNMQEGRTEASGDIARELRKLVAVVGGTLAVLWVYELVDQLVFLNQLDRAMAVYPRSVRGLKGIALFSFAHGGFGHLIGNSVPLAIFATIIAGQSIREYFRVVVWSGIVSGVGIWSIAPAHSMTVGASGLVFGLFAYIVVRGFVMRSFGAMALSLVIAGAYASMVFGMLPLIGPAQVSWQGHLFGFIGGVIAARRIRRR